MPQLVIPKTYRAHAAPRVIDLDNFRLSLEAFFNSTKLDDANIDLSAISAAISAAQSRTIVDNSDAGSVTTATATYTVVENGLYVLSVGILPPGATDTNSADTTIDVSYTVAILVNGVSLFSTTLRTYQSRFSSSATHAVLSARDGGNWIFVQSFSANDIISVSVGGVTSVDFKLVKLLESA